MTNRHHILYLSSLFSCSSYNQSEDKYEKGKKITQKDGGNEHMIIQHSSSKLHHLIKY
jgi:hypothetical protein